MDTSLLVTTVSAVAVAVVSLVLLVVVFLRERRRSEARVIALRRMAGDSGPAAEFAVGPTELDDLDIAAESSTRAMFTGSADTSPWPARLAVAAITIVVIGAAGYVLLPREDGAAAQESQTAAAGQAPPLELLSLRHNQEVGALVITGLVQNPRAGQPLTRVVATAFLFSSDGTFLASGRAPLDFSTLAAGDESPFVLSVPVTTPVARYRVGFRAEDGRVIAHIDRRAAGTLARTGE
jgi:hypothetical protein